MFSLLGFPALIAFSYFLAFLILGYRNNKPLFMHFKILIIIGEIFSFIVLPALYIDVSGYKNDCCNDSAVFSSDHILIIVETVILCLISYFYSSYRTNIAPPVIEILVNTFILIGIVLNVFIAFHAKELLLALLGNVPIMLYGILMLANNHTIFIEYNQNKEIIPKNNFEKFAWKVLTLKPLLKFSVLFVLCLPLLVIISGLLLIFGQKPDSFIRAFTDTYKHGFSQLDYQCENVSCGGHYLCSVAANGHKKVVKRLRLGIRNGKTIVCNRQLLISNAFEELIQEKNPFLHQKIRNQYNKVGDFIHRYYHIFNNKFVSDYIYVLMKPLEWFFLLILYTFDRKPENRIAKQYVSSLHRQLIDRNYSSLN